MSTLVHFDINSENIEKLVVSNNGKYLLFGGRGLNVLDMKGGKFKLIRNDKRQNIKFSTIKILKNDNVLITEPGTNDLVLFNPSFDELMRLPGVKGDCFGKFYLITDNEAIRSSITSNDSNNHFVWFKGGKLISIVDLNTFQTREIDILAGKYAF
jgi:hypothetical protein